MLFMISPSRSNLKKSHTTSSSKDLKTKQHGLMKKKNLHRFPRLKMKPIEDNK